MSQFKIRQLDHNEVDHKLRQLDLMRQFKIRQLDHNEADRNDTARP